MMNHSLLLLSIFFLVNLCGCDPHTKTIIRDPADFGFSFKGTNVYWKGKVLPGADAQTFEVCSQAPSEQLVFAKDSSLVYLRDSVIDGADPSSFSIVKGAYSKDAKNVYCGTIAMKNAAPETFEVVFDYGIKMCVPELAEMHFGKPIDTGCFAMAWSRDAENYFYGPVVVQDADYDSFQVVNESEAFDKNGRFTGRLRKKDAEDAMQKWKKKYRPEELPTKAL